MNPALLFLLPVILTSATPPPQPPPSVSCSDELVTFSTCLSYAAMSPNNGTDSPSLECCEDISAAFSNKSAVCLCYFIHQPDIMGFPLNSTKVMSITTVCALNDEIPSDRFSLQTLCSGSTSLPPLNSVTGIASANNFPLPIANSSQGHGGSSSNEQEPADELPTQPVSSTVQGALSSATQKNIKLGWILVAIIVYIFACVNLPAS